MEYPKMLYGPHGQSIAKDADEEARMRAHGQVTLAEQAKANGRDTCPAAPARKVMPWDVVEVIDLHAVEGDAA